MAFADEAVLANKATKDSIKVRNIIISTLVAFIGVMLVALVVLSFFVPGPAESTKSKPNIIFILADDLGWNDVGFHGSNQIPTPNIDALAYSGIILNDYYVSPLCTPSRSALMTGKHPTHTGMQHEVIYGFQPWGLGLEERLLPQYLKDEGYATHLVGKWHLGHFQKEYTPTFRGFDTHFGFWTGHQDYYDHNAEESPSYWGFDMRRDMNVSRDTFGQYTTTLLSDEAVKLVHEHDTSKPMFLLMAHAAPHAGNPSIPLQAPDDVVQMFDNEFIPDVRRQKYAAMVWLLDQSVGKIVKALSEKKMLKNSIIIFSSDNGGAGGGYNRNVASNWPLRGGKDTTWEGGVKAAALIWSPLLNEARKVFTKICSIQDWLPTLMAAIGSKKSFDDLDGKNIWPALNDPTRDTYKEILVQIDSERNISAIRDGNFKLIMGTTWDGIYDISLGAEGRNGEYNLTLIKESDSAKAIKATSRDLPDSKVITQIRDKATVTCKKENEELLCDPTEEEFCLFDLALDPCESVNLADDFPEIVYRLEIALRHYNRTVVTPRNQPADPLSNPKFWDYEWINWMDYPTPPHLESQLVEPNTQGLDII